MSGTISIPLPDITHLDHRTTPNMLGITNPKETTIEDHTLLQKLLIEGKMLIDNYPKLLFNIDSFGLKPYYIYEYNAYESNKRTLFSKLLHGKKVKYRIKDEIKKVRYIP